MRVRQKAPVASANAWELAKISQHDDSGVVVSMFYCYTVHHGVHNQQSSPTRIISRWLFPDSVVADLDVECVSDNVGLNSDGGSCGETRMLDGVRNGLVDSQNNIRDLVSTKLGQPRPQRVPHRRQRFGVGLHA
jgi:hypothetical protein